MEFGLCQLTPALILILETISLLAWHVGQTSNFKRQNFLRVFKQMLYFRSWENW